MLLFRPNAKVIPFEAAFPRGLFEPFRAPPCEHDLRPGEPIDLQGLPRPLATLRCRFCRAIEVLEVPHVD